MQIHTLSLCGVCRAAGIMATFFWFVLKTKQLHCGLIYVIIQRLSEREKPYAFFRKQWVCDWHSRLGAVVRIATMLLSLAPPLNFHSNNINRDTLRG